ncbi:MAG: D-alanyl-D-alanine carboxypeptidase/D-alanyl-D-alanine-endopeptidase [Flavobacterium sp.]|nr:D-alanyl-D-alanine carboxypeptidase/D-alanyl-D-alanine-endopeptidase [Pedobacter sp.]
MRLALTFIYSFFVFNCYSQTFIQKVENAYKAFENDPQLKYATSSLTILDASSGVVVFSKNENTGLAPASTLKTITAATVLQILGADYTWKTTLGYSGVVSSEGMLNGNLILTGGGDPTLGSWRYSGTKPELLMKKWVQAIKENGIKKITGRLVADDTLFGSQTLPVGWIWQDIGNYYGAGPNSLTWRENQFDLNFKPGLNVEKPTVLLSTSSEMPALNIINEVKTGASGSGDNVYAYSSPYSNIVYLRGTYGIDLKKTISASMPDPAQELVNHLQDTLKSLGIFFTLPATTRRQLIAEKQTNLSLANIISVHTSPVLSQIIYWFNQKSINLYGEHFLKTIALVQGKNTDTSEGAEIVKDFWKSKLNIDPNALNIIDGSGLSPGNRVTTKAMAKILLSVKNELWFKTYLESFPVYNDMKMKSGTINGVLAYAGYQTNSSGAPFVFSFIVNNYNGSSSDVRQKMFKILNLLK